MEVVSDFVYHIQESYDWALSVSDKRVADWFLMQSYTPTLVLTALYLAVVWGGMRLMQNREPVKLHYTLFFYNMGLVALNFHIFYELFTATWRLGYSYSCQSVSFTDDPDEMRVAKALWWYYFSKLLEFMDTVFFILRKKNNQVSFLHVYHHASMFPIWWMGVKWVAGGQSFFGAMINSFIHVLMYSYYGISALGPEFQKYLWWKRYLTRLQLVQFVAGMVHAAQSLILDCAFPKWMQWSLIFYGSTILSLFLNFYFHAYIKAKPKSTKEGVSNGHPSNGHVTKNGNSKKNK